MPVHTCQSTDPDVALSIYYYGDSADCIFNFDVYWGDGDSSQNLVVTQPADGYRILTHHTFATAGVFTITVTGEVPVGNCVANPFAVTFTLLDYAALGDSYSAGVGAGAILPIPGAASDCLRSANAYPELVDEYLGNNPAQGNAPFYFVACSGAVIADFTKSQHTGVPAQLAALEHGPKRVGLVTFTISGNDADFADVMSYCATRSSRSESCEDEYKGVVAYDLLVINDRLAKLFKTIKRLPSLARNARVIVLGYPKFFPKGQTKACPTGFLSDTFEPSDMAWINASIASLDGEIQRAANAAGFTYVNTYDAFKGHELCDSDPYLNAAEILNIGTSYHPTASGQATLARYVEKALSD